MNPQSRQKANRDHKVTNQYIKPEKLDVNIRPGDKIEFDVTFEVHESYPVDVYFLTDLSGSMQEFIKTVERETDQVIKQLKGVMGENVKLRMGAGSFIEKPTTPFTTVGGHHVFKNWMTLADIKQNTQKLIGIERFGFFVRKRRHFFDFLSIANIKIQKFRFF